MNPNDVATRSFDDRPAGLSVEQALLLETACDAFEAAWRGGGRPDIGAAVLALPEPIRPTALRELIHLDVYYRRKAGEASAAADYAGRFPDLNADWLAAAVGGGSDVGDDVTATASVRGANTVCLPPGTRIGFFGDYELIGEIARGAMGVVYKSRQIISITRAKC